MNKEYQSPVEMWREEKNKREHIEGRVKELDNSLSIALEINNNYQRELKEVKEDNQKLSLQINDLEKKVRRIQSEH
jgi:chromosome segregation ATPase